MLTTAVHGVYLAVAWKVARTLLPRRRQTSRCFASGSGPNGNNLAKRGKKTKAALAGLVPPTKTPTQPRPRVRTRR